MGDGCGGARVGSNDSIFNRHQEQSGLLITTLCTVHSVNIMTLYGDRTSYKSCEDHQGHQGSQNGQLKSSLLTF